MECGHVIESQGMESYMQIKTERTKDVEIVAKACPKCKTPLSSTHRYNNYIKSTFKDIIEIKAKVFGNAKENNIKRKNLERRVADLREAMHHFQLSKFC